MSENKDLVVKKESIFTRIINKIKSLFGKNNKEEYIHEIKTEAVIEKEEYNKKDKKKEFLENIKIEADSEIISLKIKLENGEIKAIDLIDEQIDELQKIYDKEIEKKKNKIKKLKDAA